jgi:hypothetical protein
MREKSVIQITLISFSQSAHKPRKLGLLYPAGEHSLNLFGMGDDDASVFLACVRPKANTDQF